MSWKHSWNRGLLIVDYAETRAGLSQMLSDLASECGDPVRVLATMLPADHPDPSSPAGEHELDFMAGTSAADMRSADHHRGVSKATRAPAAQAR